MDIFAGGGGVITHAAKKEYKHDWPQLANE